MQRIILYVLNIMRERDKKGSIRAETICVLFLHVFQTSKLDDGT